VDAVEIEEFANLSRRDSPHLLFEQMGFGRPVESYDPRRASYLLGEFAPALEAAGHHGFRGSLHLWGDPPPGGERWGPPRDLAWLEEHLPSRQVPAALVRVAGTGADLLFGLEEGLHRFHGLAGQPAHVWVDLLEPSADFTDKQWLKLPGPPTPRAARGTPMREVVVAGDDRTQVGGEPLDLPWKELPARLAEAAVARLLAAHEEDRLEALWRWSRPISGEAAPGADGEEKEADS